MARLEDLKHDLVGLVDDWLRQHERRSPYVQGRQWAGCLVGLLILAGGLVMLLLEFSKWLGWLVVAAWHWLGGR